MNSRTLLPRFAAIALVPVLSACPAERADHPDVAREYAPELGVELRTMDSTESGARYRTVAEGEGEIAAAGDRVRVHYDGHLPDGSRFDSSRERDVPFEFVVGAGQVIRGWDEGVAGMREGETRLLVIPPELAYGEAGRPPVIPPRATLVFEVELLEIVDG